MTLDTLGQFPWPLLLCSWARLFQRHSSLLFQKTERAFCNIFKSAICWCLKFLNLLRSISPWQTAQQVDLLTVIYTHIHKFDVLIISNLDRKRWKKFLQGSGRAKVPNSDTMMRFLSLFCLYESLLKNRLLYVTWPSSIWKRCIKAMPSNQWLYLRKHLHRHESAWIFKL